MKKIILFVFTVVYAINLFAALPQHQFFSQPRLLKQSKQLILVITNNWNASQGQLYRFSRSNVYARWQAINKPIKIVIGKKGMGWDAAFKNFNFQGPYKKEGDNKSPAGIFAIKSVFGFSQQPNQKIKLSYLSISQSTICVDDSASVYYNQIIDASKINRPDWKSAEQMRDIVDYTLGMVVTFNENPTKPNLGSCVFLHIWDNQFSGTAGCTAMSKFNLEKLLYWLNPKDNPVIVQLPKDQYEMLKQNWKLPQLIFSGS